MHTNQLGRVQSWPSARLEQTLCKNNGAAQLQTFFDWNSGAAQEGGMKLLESRMHSRKFSGNFGYIVSVEQVIVPTRL